MSRTPRSRLQPLVLAWLLALAAMGAHAALPARLGNGQELPSLAPMLQPILAGVVNISTRSRVLVRESPLLQDPFFRHFFDLPDRPRERITRSLGSGVVVDAKRGFILTNHHVVDGADEISVTLQDGRTLKAELVGSDQDTDIAVIRVPSDHLTAIPFADSDRLRVGDFVVAIGNPFGLGQTVTSGIVSALGRSGLGIEGYEDFIQTDASINPGNSGGALVNLRGELVGINTAILAPSGGNVGIGFAIPANMARRVMAQLVAYGRVRRGQLGARFQDLTPDLAHAFGTERSGALAVRVVPGSAASQAGLKVGDVVEVVDGKPVRSAADLHNTLGLLAVGEKVELEVRREGRPLRLTAVVRAPSHVTVHGDAIDSRLAGAVFGAIDEDSPLYGQVDGVMVVEVRRHSPAYRAGLRRGDVVMGLNRRPLGSLDDLRAAAKAAGSALLLSVRRGDTSLFILVQ